MGINPITVRGKDGNVSIGRMWVSSSSGQPLVKHLVVTIWKGSEADPDVPASPPVLVDVDEDTFINGLRHLFPNGELTRKEKA